MIYMSQSFQLRCSLYFIRIGDKAIVLSITYYQKLFFIFILIIIEISSGINHYEIHVLSLPFNYNYLSRCLIMSYLFFTEKQECKISNEYLVT